MFASVWHMSKSTNTTKKNNAKKAAPKKAVAKKAPAKKAPAKKAPAKKAAVKKAPAKKAPAKKATKAIQAHEAMHEDESIKIDFLNDARDGIVEWAKEWSDENDNDASPSLVTISLTPTPKKNIIKRVLSKLFRR